MTFQTVMTVLTTLGFGGVLSILINAWVARRKNRADARDVEIRGELAIVDSAVRLTESLYQDLDRVREECAGLRSEVGELSRQNAELGRRVSEIQAQSASYEAALTKLEQENAALRRRCEELAAERDALQTRLQSAGGSQPGE